MLFPRRRPVPLGLIFVLASLVFAACSSGTSSAAAPVNTADTPSAAAPAAASAAPAAGVTLAPSTVAANAAAGDPCGVITSDEAAAILGAPLSAAPQMDLGGTPDRFSCFYTAAESPAGNYHSMRIRVDASGVDAASVASAFATMKTGAINAQSIAKEIPGLGDGAFGSATSGKIGDAVVPVEVHVTAYKGKNLVVVDVGPTTGIDPQGTLDAVVSVIGAAFSRM